MYNLSELITLSFPIAPHAQPVEMEGCGLFVSRVSAAMDGCSEAPRDGFTAARETNNPHPGSVAEHAGQSDYHVAPVSLK